jgi:hypothetical protein
MVKYGKHPFFFLKKAVSSLVMKPVIYQMDVFEDGIPIHILPFKEVK